MAVTKLAQGIQHLLPFQQLQHGGALAARNHQTLDLCQIGGSAHFHRFSSRALEGSLVRLGAYASLTGQTITLEMAKSVLRDLIGTKKKIVSMDDIQEMVGARFHVKIADLKSRRRSKTLVYPRQIAMYLCRELTDSSYPEIGRQFGGKDHTTIIHACKQVIKAKNSDSALSATLDSLKEQILRA